MDIFAQNKQLFECLVPYLDWSTLHILSRGEYAAVINSTKKMREMRWELDKLICADHQLTIVAIRNYGIFAVEKLLAYFGGNRNFKYIRDYTNFKFGDERYIQPGILAIVHSDPYFAAWFRQNIDIEIDAADLAREMKIAQVLSGEFKFAADFDPRYEIYDDIIVPLNLPHLKQYVNNDWPHSAMNFCYNYHQSSFSEAIFFLVHDDLISAKNKDFMKYIELSLANYKKIIEPYQIKMIVMRLIYADRVFINIAKKYGYEYDNEDIAMMMMRTAISEKNWQKFAEFYTLDIFLKMSLESLAEISRQAANIDPANKDIIEQHLLKKIESAEHK